MPIFIRLVVCLLTTCVLLPAPANLVHAQSTLNRGALENPGDGKHYSGIGVISGWHCLEGRLTVSFNGGEQIPLAYGSNRRDTRSACGGFENTGFGSIFNWALLGAGTHTAVAYHDGVEFARSTFTVGTTAAGDEYLRGVSARKRVRDFPREGETTTLAWNENTQHLEILSWQPAPRASAYEPLQAASATAALENPAAGQNYSGIGIISGWKCSAVALTARVDGGPSFPVLYGNLRDDTRKVCGDANNGFVVPSWNWGILGAGTHTIVVYDQGVEFAQSTFTVGTAGVEFVEGVSRQITVFGFPYSLDETDFEWNESSQHFEMIGGPGDGGGGSGPTFGTATIADQSYTQNTAIPPLTLPAAGGGSAPLTYSLSPALPAGLLFNQVTRVLSGTPTSTLSTTPYTYTVTDATGATAMLSFSLTVMGSVSPLGFGPAAIADQSYTQGAAIAPLTLPEAGGGRAPLTYSLSPALPAGLLFYPSTRVLSGTPTSTLGTTLYTYTVTDASGVTASLTFNLTVTGSVSPLSFGAAAVSAQSYTQNTAITSLTLPQATGGTAPLRYRLSPALPAGLSFDASTRVLSGTPTTTQATTAYTYTVTDGTGATATLSFSLTVAASSTPATLTNTIGMEFVLIPAGTFQMGSPATEPGRYSNEGPVHQVTIGQGFYLGKYEVTQAQWRAVMGNNPSHFSNCDTCPVERVSWSDIQGFIEELNLKEKVTTYRLPSEAEWEYAARAGTQTVYSFGNAENRLGLYAWYAANASRKTHPVGGKRPNAFGLYDVHGNVWEWVQDCWNDNYHGAPTDGSAWLTGTCSRRVLRSGAWDHIPRNLRSALRSWSAIDDSNDYGDGFRLARSLN